MRKMNCIWQMRQEFFLAGGSQSLFNLGAIDFSSGALRVGRGSLGIRGNPVSGHPCWHLNLKLYLTKGRNSSCDI